MADGQIDSTSDMINVQRQNAVTNHIREGIGRKIFMLTPLFSLLFIAIIIDVVGDAVELDVETTHFQQLENRRWFIHIDFTEAFFIERDDAPRIPELKDFG